jgi:hypothetical protein
MIFSVNISSTTSARISGTEIAVGTFQMVGPDKVLHISVTSFRHRWLRVFEYCLVLAEHVAFRSTRNRSSVTAPFPLFVCLVCPLLVLYDTKRLGLLRVKSVRRRFSSVLSMKMEITYSFEMLAMWHILIRCQQPRIR